jgi:hypothetical protein
MVAFLRAIKVGAVNLFGVAIPGFLLMFFSLIGVVAPALAICFGYLHIGDFPIGLWESNKSLAIAVVVIFSYVAGYILRLSTPDEVDEPSAKGVIKDYMKRGLELEIDCWPYAGDKDKYPYDNFWYYLEERGLTDLRREVKWGRAREKTGEAPQVPETKFDKRSKTAVAKMKLDVMVNCPNLFAEIESNEAHVRLMSGTWLAIKAGWKMVLFGMILTVAGIRWLSPPSGSPPTNPHSWLVILLVTNTLLLVAMLWGRGRIVKLFHYRRVNELVWIVMAANYVRHRKDAGLVPQTSSDSPE